MILFVGIEHLSTYRFQALNVIRAVLFPEQWGRGYIILSF